MFAATQFVLAFPPARSVISDRVMSSLRSKAMTMLGSKSLSPLERAQFTLQAQWLEETDIAFLEYLMFATGGLTVVPPAPNSTYITMWVALMVSNSNDPSFIAYHLTLIHTSVRSAEVQWYADHHGAEYLLLMATLCSTSNPATHWVNPR